MDKYWTENTQNGKWHFLRNTEDIPSYTGAASQVMGKLLDQNLDPTYLSSFDPFTNVLSVVSRGHHIHLNSNGWS